MGGEERKHSPTSAGPNPYGYMCYCRNCGKTFGSYKDVAHSECPKQPTKPVINDAQRDY